MNAQKNNGRSMNSAKLIAATLLIFSATTMPTATSGATTSSETKKSEKKSELKTYKVMLSKSDKSTNRDVYITAKTSSDAREQAKDANPGWKVELVTEVK